MDANVPLADFDARGEIGEQHHGASGAHMLVPLFAVAGIARRTEYAHLRILEDQLVVARIDRQRIEIARAFRLRRRSGLFDLDFDNAQRPVADGLADVHAAGGAPHHVAGLPVQVLGRRVGVGEVLIAAIEIDHHAIEIVLVERRRLVRMLDCGNDADARIVHSHGTLGSQPERQQGEENRSHGIAKYIPVWARRFRLPTRTPLNPR